MHTECGKKISIMGGSSKTKSSSNLQVASASSKKRSKPDKEDAPPKKRGKTDAEKAEAKEAAKARAKAKKAAERESESEDAGSDAEDEEYQPDVVDENDDDVMEDIYTTGKTPEQIEDDRKKLVKTKARRRGYRTVANKGGYSALYDSGYSHLDVATPILSEGEVIRACKWAPKMTNKAAYEGLTEFEERHRLSHKSLPPSRGLAPVAEDADGLFVRAPRPTRTTQDYLREREQAGEEAEIAFSEQGFRSEADNDA